MSSIVWRAAEMFYPVPRVDRWEPVIAGVLALLIAAALVAAAIWTA